MTAVVWFFISAVICTIAALLAVFVVTPYKAMNIWVSMGFFAGAILNLVLILVTMLRPS